MKMPCLSIKQRLLSLIIVAVLLGFGQNGYTEGLSGLKDSLNKGKINKNEVEAASDSRPEVASESAVVEIPAKTKRITGPATTNVKTKFAFVDKKQNESKVKPPKSKKEESKEFNEQLKNSYNKMLVALKQVQKKKKASPRIAAVRIGDDPDSSIPAQLPEDFLKNVDTDELAIRAEVQALYDSFPNDSASLENFYKACDALYGKYYRTRPDICYLVKLIKIDARLKNDPNSALEDQTIRMLRWPSSFEPVPYPSFQTSMYEEYLKMSRDTEAGNDLIKFVNMITKKRQNQIKKANDDLLVYIRNEISVLNKLKADYEAYVKELLSLKHILPGSTSNYENGTLNLQNVMRYAIDDIKAHYSKISQRYLIIAIYLNSAGQWEESLNLTKEFKDYFEKNCPYKFTIKLAGKFDYDAAASSGNLGNLKIIEKDLLIDKDNLKWGPKRIDQAALECMSRLSLQNVTDQPNSLEFRDKIILFAETNIADQEEVKEYKKETKVEEIRILTNELTGISNIGHIFAANDRICLKCYYEPGYNIYYQPPISITLTSKVSNRYKYITVIGNRGESASYAIFQSNEIEETSPEPPPGPIPTITAAVKTDNYTAPIFNRNLVNTTRNAQKESISVLSGFEYYEDGLTLYDNKQFFTNQLVRSSWRGLDVTKNRLWNSAPFCRAGGAEIISVSLQNKEIFALVRNQADWFVIEAHGDFDGHFEFKDFQNLTVKMRPEDLENKFNEDIDVLILNTCYVLDYPKRQHAKKWQKVLPNGLILGFEGEVYPKDTKKMFSQFSAAIKNKMTPKEIGDEYLETCKKILNSNPTYLQWGSGTYEKAVYVLGNIYGLLIQESSPYEAGHENIGTYKIDYIKMP